MSKTKKIRAMVAVVVALVIAPAWSSNAFAQRGGRGGGGRPAMGGGGAKPSLGHVGGGGARPNMGNMSGARPSMPNISRPNTPSISKPNVSRPSLGNVNARPSMPSAGGNASGRPSLGGSRPSLGGAGNLPNTSGQTKLPSNPGATTRPSLPKPSKPPQIKPPGMQMPSSRPSSGIGQVRPSLPDKSNRPSLGNINRPTTLPGEATRPSFGGNRPTTLPGSIDRPMIGGNRPSGNINKPGLGNNNNIVNRPIIGGDRPSIGNNSNVNIGNTVNIGNNVGNRFPNRPNWDVDPGYSRPGWGLNVDGNWNSNWHNNCINNHHYWYNGCWHGYWGSSWYAPVVWGGIGWGLGSMTNSWGYNNAAYYNPYFAESTINQAIPYDYSQPVVVNNYASSNADNSGSETQIEPSTPQQTEALTAFDQGLVKFKAAQYVSALTDFNAALKQLPGDAVVHEVRSLALFAIGDYKTAAVGLNSLLSAAPGMDWTTMSGLYGNSDDYTTQLRKLEQFCESNPNDASAYFVLAYHYLVTGSKDGAINALEVVVKNQPKDITAKRMLDAMVPPRTLAPSSPIAASSSPIGVDAPQTDLVGKWLAQLQDTNIELSITEDSKFTWKAGAKDQKPVELTGELSAESNEILLETKEQGAIGGTVESKGPDNWVFIVSGSPALDSGLSFARVK